MSNFIVGNGGSRRRSSSAAAITLALVLMATPVLLATTTTEAFAASSSQSNNKDCKGIQIGTFEQDSFAGAYSDKTVTIQTSQNKQYSVKIDYFKVSNDDGPTYYKNEDAKDPRGLVLLPGGKTITVTLQTQEGISRVGNVILYKHNISDCQILLGQVPASDMIDLKFIRIEGNQEPEDFKVTVQVPNFSDVVGEQFTKLGVQFKLNPEVREYHIISNGVHVTR